MLIFNLASFFTKFQALSVRFFFNLRFYLGREKDLKNEKHPEKAQMKAASTFLLQLEAAPTFLSQLEAAPTENLNGG